MNIRDERKSKWLIWKKGKGKQRVRYFQSKRGMEEEKDYDLASDNESGYSYDYNDEEEDEESSKTREEKRKSREKAERLERMRKGR